MTMNRRSFLKGCCGGLFAISNVSIGNLVFARGESREGGRDIIVNVFLRGAMDALNFLAPYNDSFYHTARGVLGLGSQHVLDLNGYFGLHLSAAPLKELYDNGDLALVCACGSPSNSRSHFDAQDFMDRGKPDDTSFTGGGWLARHLMSYPQNSESIFQAVSHGSTVSTSLEGFANALALTGASGFALSGSSTHRDDLRRSLRTMYAGDAELAVVAARTLDAADIVDRANPSEYTPQNGAVYQNNGFGNAMRSIAQMIRLDLGLQAVTVDIGGWDTHENQAGTNDPLAGTFSGLVAQLSDGLHAFWTDLDTYHNNITVVVMSEFGRRLRENNNAGTDHGHGSVAIVLSGAANGGQVYGTWPGLATEQLFQSVDLQVTTDFRTVLAEIVQKRLKNNNLASVFPNFANPGALGLFPG